MSEYISREAAVDAGYLSDWYISSVGDEPPVWTDEHINELLNDFLVVPKDTPAADVQPVKHGRWERRMTKIYACSECTNEVTDRQRKNYSFCPYCGTRMDGDNDEKRH